MAVKTNYEKNGIKYYRQTRDVGKDENGKRIRKEFLGHNKKESDAKYEAYMAMRKMGIDIDASKQLLYPSMLKWHQTVIIKDVHNKKLKLSSYNKYGDVLNNQIAELSFKYETLIDVSKEMIEDELSNSNFSYSQQEDTVKIIKKFYNYLISKRVLPYNPCVGIKIKQPSTLFLQIPPTFSDDDIKSVINCKTYHRSKHISLVAKEIGLREGELLASEWTDYLFKDRLVNVTKTLTYQKTLDGDYDFFITDPKTRGSIRRAPLTSFAIDVLLDLKDRQKHEMKVARGSYIDRNIVFANELGGYTNKRNLLRSHKRLLAAADVDYKKFHAYRHTFATNLFLQKKEILYISKVLGHSSIRETEKTYIHLLDEQIRREILGEDYEKVTFYEAT